MIGCFTQATLYGWAVKDNIIARHDVHADLKISHHEVRAMGTREKATVNPTQVYSIL